LINPDFVKLVEAYGIKAMRATNRKEAREAITTARAYGGPTFIDFQIAKEGEDANVYPMVPTGAALDDMIRRPLPPSKEK
jgi:acetolactate synthase-1/2/3 large subunit